MTNLVLEYKIPLQTDYFQSAVLYCCCCYDDDDGDDDRSFSNKSFVQCRSVK